MMSSLNHTEVKTLLKAAVMHTGPQLMSMSVPMTMSRLLQSAEITSMNCLTSTSTLMSSPGRLSCATSRLRRHSLHLLLSQLRLRFSNQDLSRNLSASLEPNLNNLDATHSSIPNSNHFVVAVGVLPGAS
jgi:hypothetical protein